MIGALVAVVGETADSNAETELLGRLRLAAGAAGQRKKIYRAGGTALAVSAHPLWDRSDSPFDPAIALGERYLALIWGRLTPSTLNFRSVADDLIQQGPAAAARLQGEFLLVLLDRQDGSVSACRDPLGSRGGFWSHTPPGYWLATDERSLWSAETQLDERYLASFFAADAPPPTATPMAGIHSIAPAHWLTLSPNQRPVSTQYWQFAYQPEVRRLRPAQAAPVLRELLTAAATDRVDTSSCVAISGGMDSTALAAVAGLTQALTYHLPTWPECQEHELAAQACQQLDMALDMVTAQNPGPLSADFQSVTTLNAGPELDAYAVLRQRLAAAAVAGGHRQVLSGDFADQLYLGYPYSLRDGFLAQPGRSAVSTLRRWHRQPLFWRDPLLRRLGPLNGISRGLRATPRPWLSAHARNLLPPASRHHPYYGPLSEVDRMEGCLNAATARAAHLGYLQGLEWGVEYHLPYRNQLLVEFMLSLPADCWYCPHTDQTKVVMRQAMNDVLPGAITQRRDKTSLEPLFRHCVLVEHAERAQQLLDQNDLWRRFIDHRWLHHNPFTRDRQQPWRSFELYLYWCAISLSLWQEGLPRRLTAAGVAATNEP